MKKVGRLWVLLCCITAYGCSGAVDAESQTGSVITTDATASDAGSHVCPPASCWIDGECHEPNAANPNNPCEACVPLLGLNSWTPLVDEPCEDGDPCTLEDHCVGAQCMGEPRICDDANPCTEDRCEGTGAGCVHEPLSEGASCEDGDPCTTEASCTDNICGGGLPVDCEDGNPCTASVCEAGVGCAHPAQDGLTCEDGDACTGGGVCAEGQCNSNFTITCEDESVCTADGCDPGVGCVFTDLSELCDDGNPCTNPVCDDTLGCMYAFNAEPCDDSDLCTTDDTCSEGHCQGAVVDMDDGNPCTDDSCDATSGVTHLANALPCEDGDACTLGDTCADSACLPGGQPLACDDDNVCTGDGCDPDTGCVFDAVDGACDDGSVCTLADHCAAGACVGDALDCDDQNGCTNDTCDPVEGCSNTLAVTHDCRPQITVDYPNRAATILGSSLDTTVVVSGTAKSGAGPIVSLTVNGVAVQVEGDGSFAHAVLPVTGGNTLKIEAEDSFGTARTIVQSFHWSLEYVSEAEPQNGFADPGMGIFLSQEVLDDGDHSLPADDLATVIELAFAGYDVSALIPTDQPVVEDTQGYDVYLKNPTHDSPKASLEAINGGMLLAVEIANLKADLEAQGINWWNPDLNGSLNVSMLSITATTEIFVNEDHELEVVLIHTDAEISGANVNINSWLAFILEPIINGILDDVLGDLEEEIATEMESQIGPMIADTLGTLAISQSFSIPSLDPSGGDGIELNLSTDFSDTDFASDGGAIILRTNITGESTLEHSKLGALARAGCGSDDQVLLVPRASPLEVILADDTMNLLLFRAWEGGMLSFDVPPEMIGEADLTAYGISDLILTVDGLQAPVISDCYEDGALRIHLGDLDVAASMTLLGSPLDVQIYMSLLAGFQLNVVDDAITFGLTEVDELDLEVTAVQDAFISSEALIADLVAENLIPALLDGLGGDALGGIPLPSVDLSGAMNGIPPGTVIAVAVDTVEHTSGNTIVSGDLQ